MIEFHLCEVVNETVKTDFVLTQYEFIYLQKMLEDLRKE